MRVRKRAVSMKNRMLAKANSKHMARYSAKLRRDSNNAKTKKLKTKKVLALLKGD